jgi:hypothetical protein
MIGEYHSTPALVAVENQQENALGAVPEGALFVVK